MVLENELTQLLIVTQNQLVKASAGASAVSPYSGPQELYVVATGVLRNVMQIPDLVTRFLARANRVILAELVEQLTRRVNYLERVD